MVEEIPEEDGYWELVEENSPSCALNPPNGEEESHPLLPVLCLLGGTALLGGI
jgi:hypothetical protein